VLPAIEQAVEELYQGQGGPGLRLAAAAGIAINNFLFRSSPVGGREVHGLARLRYMVLRGVPITFRKLCKSSAPPEGLQDNALAQLSSVGSEGLVNAGNGLNGTLPYLPVFA